MLPGLTFCQEGGKTMAHTGQRDPWERLPGETARQYECFCAYRDMRYLEKPKKPGGVVRPDFTVRRSIRGLAEQMGVTRKSLEPMSAKFDWVARAEEYDSYILDCVAAQNTAQIVKMHEKHAAIAEQMLRKATSRLLTIPDADIDANAVVRMVDIGVKVERLSRGEPTENRTVTHGGALEVDSTQRADLSALSDEELNQLAGLLEKSSPG